MTRLPQTLAASAALIIAIVAAALGAESQAPAKTQGLTIKGTLVTTSSLDIQKPDLSRAVVYLASDKTLDTQDPPKDAAIVAQHDKKFVPDYLVIQTGTKVEFPNEDNFDHNVFSRSKAAPAFDLDRYGFGKSKAVTFTKLGVVQVFCNIHPSMRAMIVVTPNRYFTRVNAKGTFSIDNVPPGKYTLVAWQERCDEARKEIDLSSAAAADVTITLKESRQSIMADDDPNRRDNYGLDRGLGVKREVLNLPVVKDLHDAPTTHPSTTTAPCCDN